MTASITPEIVKSWQLFQQSTSMDALNYLLKTHSNIEQNALSLIFLSCYLARAGAIDKAAECASLAEDAHKDSLSLSINNAPKEVAFASNAARIALHQFLKSQHKKIVEQAPERIKGSIWVQQTNKDELAFHANQHPHLFWVPSLPSNGWFDVNEFQWCKMWLTQKEKIKTEARAILRSKSFPSRPYVSDGDASLFPGSNIKPEWTARDFFRNGLANVDILKKCPAISSTIKMTPTFSFEINPREVFLSTLKAGSQIPPHFGLTNAALTVHFPIDIPDSSCKLTTNQISKSWSDNELLIFDDSFIHSATNPTQNDRTVLIFSIWHPDLSPIEINSLKEVFNTRNMWLKKRSIPNRQHLGIID